MLSFGRKNRLNFEEIWAGVVTCIIFLIMGVASGFSSQYISETDTGITEPDRDSWIGSSGFMFSVFGALLSGYIADKFGRKIILYSTFAGSTIGWLVIAKTPYIIVGRLIISFSYGVASGVFVYAAEVVQPKFRASLSLSFTLFELLGNLLIFFLGYFQSSLTTAFYVCILSFVLFLLVFPMPESPYWYMLKKQKEKAVRSLTRLRSGPDTVITTELEEIERTLEESDNSASTFRIIFQIKWWKKFVLFSVYVVLTEIIGFDMIIPYTEQFFGTINRTEFDDKTVAVIFMSVASLGTIVCMFFVDRVKRKPLTVGANFLNFILLMIGAASETFLFEGSSIVTLCCFFIYSTTVSITTFSLPWTIMNELIPSESRATLNAALNSEFCILYFVIAKFFPFVLLKIPINFVILMFGIFSLLNSIYIAFCLKETKDTILPGNRNA